MNGKDGDSEADDSRECHCDEYNVCVVVAATNRHTVSIQPVNSVIVYASTKNIVIVMTILREVALRFLYTAVM